MRQNGYSRTKERCPEKYIDKKQNETKQNEQEAKQTAMSNRRVSQNSIQHGFRMQLLIGALPHGLSPAPNYRLPTPGKKRGTAKEKGKGKKGERRQNSQIAH